MEKIKILKDDSLKIGDKITYTDGYCEILSNNGMLFAPKSDRQRFFDNIVKIDRQDLEKNWINIYKNENFLATIEEKTFINKIYEIYPCITHISVRKEDGERNIYFIDMSDEDNLRTIALMSLPERMFFVGAEDNKEYEIEKFKLEEDKKEENIEVNNEEN